MLWGVPVGQLVSGSYPPQNGLAFGLDRRRVALSSLLVDLGGNFDQRPEQFSDAPGLPGAAVGVLGLVAVVDFGDAP